MNNIYQRTLKIIVTKIIIWNVSMQMQERFVYKNYNLKQH